MNLITRVVSKIEEILIVIEQVKCCCIHSEESDSWINVTISVTGRSAQLYALCLATHRVYKLKDKYELESIPRC